MKKYTYIILSLITAIISSCSNNEINESSLINSEESDLIKISQAQFKSEEMEMGDSKTIYFEDEITCNGYINASRNGIAKVSSHIPGIVESINLSIGNRVKKGQILCTLSSNEFISLQENFMIISANLKVARRDFERNKELYRQNVGSEKDFNNAESEYKSVLAKYNSLNTRLTMLKLNVSRIEKGRLYSVLPIYSPINGFVASRDIVLGEFIDNKKGLMEIVNNSSLQLILSVFEKDIRQIKIGQKVKFSSLGDFNDSYTAIVSSVGHTINDDSKTIQCIAQISNIDSLNFVNKTFVNAKILIANSEAKALPNQSIIKIGKEKSILVLEKNENEIYYFKKVLITPKKTSNGYTEIEEQEDFKNVLIKGGYNISN